MGHRVPGRHYGFWLIHYTEVTSFRLDFSKAKPHRTAAWLWTYYAGSDLLVVPIGSSIRLDSHHCKRSNSDKHVFLHVPNNFRA